jgi:hypothetical protein
MGREQKRRSAKRRATKVRDKIAGVATDLFAGVIDPNFRAETFHLSLETHGDIALLAGKTVDLYELDEEVLKPILVDQNANLLWISQQRAKDRLAAA